MHVHMSQETSEEPLYTEIYNQKAAALLVWSVSTNSMCNYKRLHISNCWQKKGDCQTNVQHHIGKAPGPCPWLTPHWYKHNFWWCRLRLLQTTEHLVAVQVLSGLVPLRFHQLDCDFGCHLWRAERHKRVLKEVILSWAGWNTSCQWSQSQIWQDLFSLCAVDGLVLLGWSLLRVFWWNVFHGLQPFVLSSVCLCSPGDLPWRVCIHAQFGKVTESFVCTAWLQQHMQAWSRLTSLEGFFKSSLKSLRSSLESGEAPIWTAQSVCVCEKFRDIETKKSNNSVLVSSESEVWAPTLKTHPGLKWLSASSFVCRVVTPSCNLRNVPPSSCDISDKPATNTSPTLRQREFLAGIVVDFHCHVWLLEAANMSTNLTKAFWCQLVSCLCCLCYGTWSRPWFPTRSGAPNILLSFAARSEGGCWCRKFNITHRYIRSWYKWKTKSK